MERYAVVLVPLDREGRKVRELCAMLNGAGHFSAPIFFTEDYNSLADLANELGAYLPEWE